MNSVTNKRENAIAIEDILWRSLNSKLTQKIGLNWLQKKIIIWGAGGEGKHFFKIYPQIAVDYAVDSDKSKHNMFINGIPIREPIVLKSEDVNETIIFITSSFYEEISLELIKYGFFLNENVFIATNKSDGRIKFFFDTEADAEKVFQSLNEKNINYVVLRWFEQLPTEIDGDIDILVDVNDLTNLFTIDVLKHSPPGITLEVYWSKSLGMVDELLYYPSWLSRQILENRVIYKGMYIPSQQDYFFSLIFHAIFHKAERSGLPVSGNELDKKGYNKYREKIESLASQLDIDLEVNLDALYSLLRENNWLPPLDIARRHAINLNSKYLKEKFSSKSADESEVMVFVIREWAYSNKNILAALIKIICSLGLTHLETISLTEAERKSVLERVRGGNWFENQESINGGKPVAYLVFIDHNPSTPSREHLLLRPFCDNEKYSFKLEIRFDISKQYGNGKIINFMHASDDVREAREYIALLNDKHKDQLIRKTSNQIQHNSQR